MVNMNIRREMIEIHTVADIPPGSLRSERHYVVTPFVVPLTGI